MKVRHLVVLTVFFVVWTLIDLPLYVLRRMGLAVKELGA
jgi:hypothetical protein